MNIKSGSDTKVYLYIYVVLFALLLIWLISIIISYLFPDFFTEVILSNSVTSYVFGALRYVSSSRLDEEFSIYEFISVKNWSVYVALFLGALGSFGVIWKLVEKTRSIGAEEPDYERRKSLTLICMSLCSSIVFGMNTILLKAAKTQNLRRLYLIEVNLVRFEGLLFNSIAISNNSIVADTLYLYLGAYYNRIHSVIEDAGKSMDLYNGGEIHENFEALASSIESITGPGSIESDDAKASFTNALETIELLREDIRVNIRRLEI